MREAVELQLYLYCFRGFTRIEKQREKSVHKQLVLEKWREVTGFLSITNIFSFVAIFSKSWIWKVWPKPDQILSVNSHYIPPPLSLSPSHCTHFILFPHSIHILTHSPCSLYLSLSLSASGPDGSILARRIVNTNQHFLPPAIHITDIFLSISGLVFFLFFFHYIIFYNWDGHRLQSGLDCYYRDTSTKIFIRVLNNIDKYFCWQTWRERVKGSNYAAVLYYA